MYTTKVELERDYMPSMHSTRFQEHSQPDLAVLDNFIKLTTEQTSALHKNEQISKRTNVRYGGTNDRQLVDIFYAADSQERGTPIFVFVHGGYWQLLDKSSAGSFVKPLVKRGYRVLVMDYNLCPTVTLSQLCAQFDDFLKWVFAYAADTQTTEITFCGHSAGAHLLAQLLHTPVVTPAQVKLIKAVLLISGVYDLRELWSMESVNPQNILSLNAEVAKQLSPICWSYADNAQNLQAFQAHKTPVHVLVAAHDSETFIGHTRAYAEYLQKFGFNAVYKIFEHYDHFDIVEQGNEERTEITNYIKEVLEQ